MSAITTKQQGFTLIEVIIAIAILAMIGLATNSVLSTVVNNNDKSKAFEVRLKGWQQGMSVIERDLGQMVARTFRGEEEHGTQVFMHGTGMLDSDSQELIFHRLGWSNGDGMLPRGSLQSVAYRVRENKLERLHYIYPEAVTGVEPFVTVLLEGVLEVNYAFFLDGSWQNKTDMLNLPQGVAIEIEFENNHKLLRKFLLPDAMLSADVAEQQYNEAGEGEQNPDGNSDPNNPNGAGGAVNE
ncbi:type II secretion system minor pseudopilin GspJ [Paraferrimonas sp. SM1919]|uniref:type II secretion system minor pseudopilin GspJ n=1 Tax=Paraferrimonas sp. SM1919 TaxID=2662263 RepID=UPI0013D1B1DC|nr:type II secretion system minor pseudopilin GspJ [Paraferrimonas sp. SM1919]